MDLTSITTAPGARARRSVSIVAAILMMGVSGMPVGAAIESGTDTSPSSADLSSALSLKSLGPPGIVTAAAQPFKLAQVSANVGQPVNELESLTRQSLRKIIEIERLNNRFRMETAITSRWRQRRVFLYGEAQASCTEAGLIEQLPVRYRLMHEKRPKNVPVSVDLDTEEEIDEVSSSNGKPISNTNLVQRGNDRGKLAAATEVTLVGQSIGTAGDIFELGLNFADYLRVRREGLTPRQYHDKMIVLESEVDALLERRSKCLAASELSSADFKILRSEGQLLKDMRDLALIDFMEYHAGTKRFWALQNTAFLVDFAKNSSAMAGSIIGLEGNHLKRSRFQGTSGVFSALTGGIVLLTPIVGRVTGNVSGLAARRLVSSELLNLDCRDSAMFDRHRSELAAALNSGASPEVREHCLKRLPLYSRQEALLEENNQYLANEKKRARGSLIENVTFASLVGPTRVTNGTMQIIGGWRYFEDTTAVNRMVFAGCTAYMAGTGLNILETARVQASEEIRQHKLAKKGLRGKQRFAKRIAALDDLDSSLR